MSLSLDEIAEIPDDFPVDAERGAGWLWNAAADTLLWESGQGGDLGGSAAARFLAASPAGQRIRAIAEAAPARSAVSLERLRFFMGRAADVMTCICRPVRLRAGGYGVLVVRMGAPSRQRPAASPAAAAPVRAAATVAPSAPAAVTPSVEIIPAVAATASTAAPAAHGMHHTSVTSRQPLEEPPAWTQDPPARRKARRFVWQTDATGRFVHVSRELVEAVGAAQGVPVGMTFAEASTRLSLSGAPGLARALLARDTWSGETVLWPVGGADLRVPVELAGVPVFDADRLFQGHRGYGIARIERAEEWQWPTPAAPEATVGRDGAASVPAAVAAVASMARAEAGAGLPAVEAVEETDGVIAAVPFDETAADAAFLDAARADLSADAGGSAEGDEAAAAENSTADASAADDSTDMTVAEADEETEAAAGEAPEDDSEEDASEEDDPEEQEADGPEDGDRVGAGLAGIRSKAVAETGRSDTPAATQPPGDRKPAADSAGPADRPSPVTPLHPFGTWTAPAEPAAGSIPQPSLNPAERNAFSEIARALGARFEGTATPPPPATPPAPDAAPRQPAAASPDAAPRETLRFDPDAARTALRPVPRDPLLVAAPEILDRAPLGLLVLQDGRTAYANRTLLDLLGYPTREVFESRGGVGTLFKGRSPEAVVGEQRPLTVVDSRGEVVEVQAIMHAIAWDGRPASLVSLRRSEGEPGLAARHKALELDLQGVRRELAEANAILDTAVEGVVTVDRAGRITGLNRPAEALFGYDEGELVGEPFATLFRPDSQKTVAEYLAGLSASNVASVLNDGREVEGRERNGGTIPLFMTLGRIGEAEVGPARFCAVLRDVTHWKRTEAELTEARRKAEQASAQKSDFLARISHEVRTPLNAIIGFSQVMLSETHGPVSNERYREYLKDINMSGEHVMSLVNDLLDLSKIEAGRMDLSFTSVDLNLVIAGCVQLMQPQANAGRVLLRTQLAHRLPPVVADERSIRQIVLNLLSNATKFTDAGGQVIVSTSLGERGEAVVRVRDTGVGMSESEVRNAMEPFYQSAGTRGRGGTGLGLPLTKALVEANRAHFAIRSEPQAGTLVEVTFPATRVLAE
jgi:PAS domain S-box-containing protein